VAQQMLAEMGKNPGIVQPDIDLQLNKPELFVEVDRNRAADMGVNVDPWPARSRPCSAAVPSRATSATPTSTT
jgi:hypothetical protein